MKYFFLLLLILGIYAIIRHISRESKSKGTKDTTAYVPTSPALNIGDSFLDEQYEEWQKRYKADEYGFSIAGANFRNLDETHLGEFSGKLKREPDNPHDTNAIAIYRGRKKVGYIPRDETILLREQITINGGTLDCFGFIHTFINEYGLEKFAGIVIPGKKPED